MIRLVLVNFDLTVVQICESVDLKRLGTKLHNQGEGNQNQVRLIIIISRFFYYSMEQDQVRNFKKREIIFVS